MVVDFGELLTVTPSVLTPKYLFCGACDVQISELFHQIFATFSNIQTRFNRYILLWRSEKTKIKMKDPSHSDIIQLPCFPDDRDASIISNNPKLFPEVKS